MTMLGTPVLLTLATTLANPPSSKRLLSDFTSSQVKTTLATIKIKIRRRHTQTKDEEKEKVKTKINLKVRTL